LIGLCSALRVFLRYLPGRASLHAISVAASSRRRLCRRHSASARRVSRTWVNLCPDMPRWLSKGARQRRFADHPTAPVTPRPHSGRDQSEQVVAIKIEIGGRDQSESEVAISRYATPTTVMRVCALQAADQNVLLIASRLRRQTIRRGRVHERAGGISEPLVVLLLLTTRS
jgi:hypothetical protein